MAAPDEAAAALPPGPVLLAGDAAARLASWARRPRRALPVAPASPIPADIARLALGAWRPGERPAPPRPLYLRAPGHHPAAARRVAG